MRNLVMLCVAVFIGCAPNEIPITSSPMPDVLVPPDGIEILLSNYFSDPDGDLLIFDARSSDPSLIGTAVKRELLTLRALSNTASPVMVEVTARDPEGATASSSFLASGTTLLYEPWDTEAALDGWTVTHDFEPNSYPNLDSATVEVHDGLLYMYSASTTSVLRGISVEKAILAHEENWKFSTSAWLYSQNHLASTCIDVFISTGDETYPHLNVAYDFSGYWQVAITQAGLHEYWDPYGILLDTEKINNGWGSRGGGAPIDEAVEFGISFIDGVVTLTTDGTEEAAFNLTDLKPSYIHDVDLIWPPASGVFPSSAVAIEVANSPWCGDEYNYPPNRGRNREDRNNLVVDWIRFEAVGS